MSGTNQSPFYWWARKGAGMEIVYKGLRYDVTFKGETFALESEEGRRYCNDGYCEYCEESTDTVDSHNYSCTFPKSSFTDDLGNRWAFIGATCTDESQSFGWWRTSHLWKLSKGGGKNGSFITADPLNTTKIRRRIEDRLRKLNDDNIIIELAVRLGVSLA